jgi:hypothetical protein
MPRQNNDNVNVNNNHDHDDDLSQPQPQSRRDMVAQLRAIRPDMSGAEMARVLGCSRERVRAILGTGVLKRYSAADSIHINLGNDLRSQLIESSKGHDSISGWCRSILSLACYLQSAGVDPVVALGMRAKEVEALKSFEGKGE